MILEVAQFAITPGQEAEFEAGASKAAELFARAKGCQGMEVRRSLETPGRYLLLAKWETLENHTVDFRESEDFPKWRALVAHCFAGPPSVEHTEYAAGT